MSQYGSAGNIEDQVRRMWFTFYYIVLRYDTSVSCNIRLEIWKPVSTKGTFDITCDGRWVAKRLPTQYYTFLVFMIGKDKYRAWIFWSYPIAKRYLVMDIINFSGYKILKDRDDHVIVTLNTGRQFLPRIYYFGIIFSGWSPWGG